jgi:poly(hydroxyalkanoate) depolymerase family esterase
LILAAVTVALMAALPRRAIAQGILTRHTFTNGAGSRDYFLFTPDRHGPLPLILFLHGCTTHPQATAFNELAEARGFAVAYPLQPYSANAKGCWNWSLPQHQHRDAGEPSIIAGITREIAQHQGIDARRVFIAGHSAGAAMATVMASTYPDLYAAAGIIAGCAYQSCWGLSDWAAYQAMGPRARAVPAYIVWGTNDTVNSYLVGRLQLLQWLGTNDFADDGAANLSVPRVPTSVDFNPGGPNEHPFTVEHYRDRRNRAPVDFTTVVGMGHLPDVKGPNIVQEMTDFLLAHALVDAGRVIRCAGRASVSAASGWPASCANAV